MWMRRLLTRRTRPSLKAPPCPPPERLEEAQAAAREAGEVLANAKRLEPVVTARAARAARIHRENNLGPSFMRALEGRRA